METPQIIFLGSVFAIFVYSVVLHEIAHGFAAYRAGDPTAFMLGRLSLNPIRHIDPVMTIIVPIMLYFFAGFIFGGAKPVPVNPRNFRRPVADDIIVSLAGVTVNFFLALFFGAICHLLVYMHKHEIGFGGDIAAKVAFYGLLINIALMIFNLIPIPPLDGSHVFKYTLPPDIRRAYTGIGVYGFIILIIFINLPIFGKIMSTGITWSIKLMGLYNREFLELVGMLKSS